MQPEGCIEKFTLSAYSPKAMIEYAFVKRIPGFSFMADKPRDVIMEIVTDVKKVLSRQG